MLGRVELLVNELKEVTENIAHDLRRPITRLRGLAETTLAAPSSMEDFKELAGQVVEESDQIIQLINTILEVAETTAGIAKMHTQEVDLRELAHGAHDLFHAAAEDEGLRLEVDTPDAPVLARGDPVRLRRVVANLLDNAIKNTPRGGTIRLSTRSNSSHAQLSVSDTGTGLDPEVLPHIFKRFYRQDPSRSKAGSGLGLCLCQAIVHAHGGTITVQSAPRQGSTFTVSLPVP
jgi:signal transduction histidine kinase